MTERHTYMPNEGSNLDNVKPDLDEDWFAQADAYVGKKLVQRGRPRSDNPKRPISLRLDPAVIDWFRETGPGWQSRINDELKKVAGL